MSSNNHWNGLNTLFQIAILTLLVILLQREGEESPDSEGLDMEEIIEEISSARFQMKNETDRLGMMIQKLTRVLERWEGEDRAGSGAKSKETGMDRPTEASSPSAILDELVRVSDAHARYKYDPLQRETVEEERSRLEDLLRRKGDQTILALQTHFPALKQNLRDAIPGWVQTRLLSNVVEQMGTENADQFCLTVFGDPQYNTGVRLAAARAALKNHEDEVVERLIDVLETRDPTFSKYEQIALYFKTSPDDRAIPALTGIATDIDANRTLRRFSIEALGEYNDPGSIETLKEVASLDVHTDLRGIAIVSLNKIMGQDILSFIRSLREQMKAGDPLHQLLDNTEALWTNG